VTVGFHSPLPPVHSGVADYSASLLRALRRHGKVEVEPRRCDVALYHLGNNQLHGGIYERALAHPGVIVLHDAVLQHFFLGRLDEAVYVDEFVYNYGEWTRDLARRLWRARAGSASESRYFEYPILKRVAERSRAVIVHNPAAASAVREHAPATPVIEIPHLFDPPSLPDAAGVLRWRSERGIAARAFVFGVFGYLRESKRLFSVLDAFARLLRDVPGARLLVAGEIVSSDLQRAAGPLLAGPGVVRIPFQPEAGFWTAASAVDACINLRYPAAGETSGVAIRLMGIGKPVLLTDAPETSRFPDGACIRIPAGPGECESLWEHMVLLTSFAEVRREIGQRGAGHVRRFHSVETIAGQYWKTLCDYCL